MALKRFYQILSLLSAIFGILLMIYPKMGIVGAVIGLSNVPSNINLGFGLFFIIAGIALFTVQYLDKKLDR